MKLKILNSTIKLIFIGYFLTIIALFLYSYTQVDLNLTLSKISIWQGIQKQFQSVGYFNRPLSTNIYLGIILSFYFLYFVILRLAFLKKITQCNVWKLILATSVILTFSYNAFSYDIFNYIFDAKIITFYNQNPYLFKPLDFPEDPMLNFMRWTHRTYPYGVGWLALTTPLTLIGSNIFIVTLFLFKLLITGFYLGTAFLITKIVKEVRPQDQTVALAFFALNPLVVIESLVSAHNDIPMVFFAMLGIYLAIKKRWFFSILTVLFSYLIKQVTGVIFVPIILFALSFIYPRIKVSIENFIRLCIVFLFLGFFFVLTRMEVQPWYFLWVLPFLALLRPNGVIYLLNGGITLGLLLRYAPFLFQGDWNGNVPLVKTYVTFLVPLVFLLIIAVFYLSKMRKNV